MDLNILKTWQTLQNKLYNVKVKRPAEKKIGNSKDDKNARAIMKYKLILMQQ